MDQPIISIIHPSRGRSKMALSCVTEWLLKCVNPKQVEYIISVDVDDPELDLYSEWFNKLKGFASHSKVHGENNNVVQAANQGAKYAIGKVFVLISDDFGCPDGWDEHIMQNIDPEKEEALQIDDGLYAREHMILTMPIITKLLYDKLKYIYFPEYIGMFCDNDIAELANSMGALRKNFDKVYPHNHWTVRKNKKDATNMRHDNPESWAVGRRLIVERRAVNFGL